MAAVGNSFLNQELVMTANGMPNRYLMSSSHGGACYQNTGGAPITVGVPEKGCFVGKIGMAPSNFVMLEGGLAAAGYGTIASGPAGVAMVPQQQRTHARGNNRNPGLQKGGWTREEDEVLRQMVRHHGDRKWAQIAKSLPGRIGKQCRERWTNHLHPDIKKDIWTEEEDMMFIEAHKTYGNRWSVIARYLPGRSENTIKNHWNATKRSLDSKRRLRKKNSEQVASGHLEEYIRSQHTLASETEAAPPPPAPFDMVGYGTGLIGAGPNPSVVHAPSGSIPSELVTFVDMLKQAMPRPQSETMDLFHVPPVPLHLNTSGYYLQLDAGGNLQYGHLPAPASASVQPYGISAQELQAPYLSLYPSSFPGSHKDDVEFDRHYYGEAGAGPSGAGVGDSGGGMDDNVVAHMASEQFIMPFEEDEAILDLARWTN